MLGDVPMKKILIIKFLLLGILAVCPLFVEGKRVNGYWKKNGTYVNSYERTSVNKSRRNYNGTYRAKKSKSKNTAYEYNFHRSLSGYTYKKEVQGPRTFNTSMKKKKYAEQNGICAGCNGRFEYKEMEGDHIEPWSKGGKTEESNLQMLCIKCNRSKGAKTK